MDSSDLKKLTCQHPLKVYIQHDTPEDVIVLSELPDQADTLFEWVLRRDLHNDKSLKASSNASDILQVK